MKFAYIQSIRNEISIILIILLFFALIFYVFSLPFDAYVLAISIILLLMCVRWWIKYLSFKKNEHLKDKVAYLEHELAHVKNQQIEYRNDVESYFLTWVHQIKTPITASQLLLERNEENVVNRVRQEIVHIDNYTSLALSYLKLLNDLDAANKLFNTAEKLKGHDQLYSAETDAAGILKWKKFCNTLSLRLLLRILDRDGEIDVKNRIKKIVNKNY